MVFYEIKFVVLGVIFALSAWFLPFKRTNDRYFIEQWSFFHMLEVELQLSEMLNQSSTTQRHNVRFSFCCANIVRYFHVQFANSEFKQISHH